MRAAVLTGLALFALALPATAQPLEQNFAFGAPLDVLGNDRFRRAGAAASARPAVTVYLADPRDVRRPVRQTRASRRP